MTAKKFSIETANPKDADALIKAADAVVAMDSSQVKAAKAPNVVADVANLQKEAARGGVKMTVRKGTDTVTAANVVANSGNTGGAANHTNQIRLTIDLKKATIEILDKEVK